MYARSRSVVSDPGLALSRASISVRPTALTPSGARASPFRTTTVSSGAPASTRSPHRSAFSVPVASSRRPQFAAMNPRRRAVRLDRGDVRRPGLHHAVRGHHRLQRLVEAGPPARLAGPRRPATPMPGGWLPPLARRSGGSGPGPPPRSGRGTPRPRTRADRGARRASRCGVPGRVHSPSPLATMPRWISEVPE